MPSSILHTPDSMHASHPSQSSIDISDGYLMMTSYPLSERASAATEHMASVFPLRELPQIISARMSIYRR